MKIKGGDNMEEKKSKKKTVAIVIILIIMLIAGAVGGYYFYQNYEQNKTVGSAWGDKYHVYLKNAIADTQADRNATYGMPNGMENTKIQFIENTENKPPKMAMTYTLEGKEFVNIYYINDDDTIGYMAYKQPSTLQLLYNIELKQYIWYIHVVDGNNHSYKAVDMKTQEPETSEDAQNTSANETAETTVVTENTTVENTTANETNTTASDTASKMETDAEYTFTEEEMKTDDTTEVAEGEIPTISKFDETFVVPEIEDNGTSIDLNSKVEDKALKEAVKSAVEGYKPEEKIVTDEVKTKTEEAVSKLEAKKAEIKKAEEDKKKKEEEEAARKAAEEEAKGLKVGNFHLKYGKYECDERDSLGGGTYTINKDGTFSFVNNWTNVHGEKYTDTASGTYKVYYSEGDDYDPTNAWVIQFNLSKYHSTYEPANSYPTETKAFDVTKDNTFQYRQSVGTYTYVGE